MCLARLNSQLEMDGFCSTAPPPRKQKMFDPSVSEPVALTVARPTGFEYDKFGLY